MLTRKKRRNDKLRRKRIEVVQHFMMIYYIILEKLMRNINKLLLYKEALVQKLPVKNQPAQGQDK